MYAKTQYRYEETFSQYHTVTAKTGEMRYGAGFMAGSYRFRVLLPYFGDTSWNYVTDLTQVRLFGDFYLPLYVERIRGEGFVSYERPYRQEEKEEAAKKLQEYYQKNLMEKGVQIIENNAKIQEDGVLWKVEGIVTGEEQIGTERYLTEFEETEENKE